VNDDQTETTRFKVHLVYEDQIEPVDENNQVQTTSSGQGSN